MVLLSRGKYIEKMDKKEFILWLSLLSTHLVLCFFSSIYNDNINHDSDFQVSV